MKWMLVSSFIGIHSQINYILLLNTSMHRHHIYKGLNYILLLPIHLMWSDYAFTTLSPTFTFFYIIIFYIINCFRHIVGQHYTVSIESFLFLIRNVFFIEFFELCSKIFMRRDGTPKVIENTKKSDATFLFLSKL